MSRRRGEFEHRTSIFEGAFRAWSHLGGLEPHELETMSATDLDPLTHTFFKSNSDGRREYPYEPLPRSGLAHPYVQAILSPWLGPDADNEAIQLGLTTLRTWWQHRRKGESGSAIAALGTEKMKGVVEGYTRHFFTLAHCLVMNDKEQPPRSLHTKLKALEKQRNKRKKQRKDDNNNTTSLTLSMTTTTTSTSSTTTTDDDNLSPLERLHLAQRRQLADNMHSEHDALLTTPMINIKNKCIPGKVDLPQVLEQVNHHATQLAHRGTGTTAPGGAVTSSNTVGSSNAPQVDPSLYGDPRTTPVVYVDALGTAQIALSVDGITCAHCVKIVETVLRGCNGNKSPIAGLLDAAADRVLNSVLVKIDAAANAKRIAFEAARNLAMVGYTAHVKEMEVNNVNAIQQAWHVVATTETTPLFDWNRPCTCPENGVLRDDCSRHSQMGARIFDAFDTRQRDVTEYMAGSAMKFANSGDATANQDNTMPSTVLGVDTTIIENQIAELAHNLDDDQPLHVDQPLDFNFGMGPPAAVPVHTSMPSSTAAPLSSFPVHVSNTTTSTAEGGSYPQQQDVTMKRRSERNPSILSYGNGPRGMSITSETTFGRAMSGLSALSIDWENLEDFDLEVDHSAHIQNNNHKSPMGKRSSLRRSYMATDTNDGPAAHVSFQI